MLLGSLTNLTSCLFYWLQMQIFLKYIVFMCRPAIRQNLLPCLVPWLSWDILGQVLYKAGVHYTTFAQIFAPVSGEVDAICWNRQIWIDRFHGKSLSVWWSLSPIPSSLRIPSMYDILCCFRTRVVFICHVSPSNKARVSAWACCVRRKSLVHS